MGTGNSLAMLPFFVRDYIAATRHLTLAERGALLDLLFQLWELGALPKDPARLARVAGATPEEFAEVWPAIRSKFVETETGLINTRLEEHRAESMRRSAKARASAEARWGGQSHAIASANALPAQSDGTSGAHAQTMLPSPSPSPSPDPSPQGNGEARASARPARTAMRLPEDWELTPERRQVAVSEGVDPDRTFAKFVDHWRAESGQKARKADWDAAWRNWCRRETEHSRSAQTGAKLRGPTAEESDRESLRKLIARRPKLGLADFRDPEPGETADHYCKAQDAEYSRRERQRVERDHPVQPVTPSRPVGTVVAQLAAAKRAPA